MKVSDIEIPYEGHRDARDAHRFHVALAVAEDAVRS